MPKVEPTIEELYANDREAADIFGDETLLQKIALNQTPLHGTRLHRRRFLGHAGIAAMGAVFGGALPEAMMSNAFAQDKPAGGAAAPEPAAKPTAKEPAKEQAKEPAKGPQPLNFPGKDSRLVVLGDRPLVAETPADLLDDDTTPIDRFYIRNNGQIPEPAKDPDKWEIMIDGEVNKPLKITLGELKAKYKPQTRYFVLECGGNGRSDFTPQARGNQWTNGGAGCAAWTGIRLADVLKTAGLKSSAVYTAHYAADLHLSGDPSKPTLSRGVPIKKALDPDSMIVWAMNGEPLPNIHGGPVRLVYPGWPGSTSQKWLTRIWIRDREHDGPGMTEFSYRVPINPMVPGGKGDPKNFRILESMPVRSIITHPANGATLAAGTRKLALRGAAWAGDNEVRKVDVSTDYGSSWHPMTLGKPRNRYDWQRWIGRVDLPSDGYYEIWVRATDSAGRRQPQVAGNWNPQGYGGNAMHRIAVLIG